MVPRPSVGGDSYHGRRTAPESTSDTVCGLCSTIKKKVAGQSVLRCQLRPGQKGSAGVVKTRRVIILNHNKITLVTDANGLPVDLELVRGRPVKGGLDYSVRWKVEKTFAWLGNFRRLIVRHERYLSTFRAFFLVALIRILMRYF